MSRFSGLYLSVKSKTRHLFYHSGVPLRRERKTFMGHKISVKTLRGLE